MSPNPAIPNLDSSGVSPHPSLSPSSMAIAKRIHPGALIVDKGSSLKNAARPIPAFLTKLFTMVNDPSTNHLIKWNEPNGDSFFVISSEKFGRELLPKYFKHSNFGSFVRQLNMYGFHKVPHLNQGVLQGEIPETEMLEFTNLNFQRGQPDLLCLIQRKKPSPELTNPTTTDGVEPLPTTLPASSSNSNHDLQIILADIASIKKQQNLISADLETLQSSNAHLWKEAIANRDRNKRCQDTINKILGFLAQVFAGKLSSLQDPPPGGSVPELERHRSRSQKHRDHQHSRSNDLGLPPSPSHSALSLYSNLRHPRLMLEDKRKPSPPGEPPTDPSDVLLAQAVSNSNTTFLNGPSVRSRSSNDDRNDPNINEAHSPSLSPRNSSSADSIFDLVSSPAFCDSSIDPNLETASIDGAYKTTDNSTTTNDSGKTGTPDRSNPDAVLQALFNDNFSNTGGYNLNDNLLSGINWAEVFNASDQLNGSYDDKKLQRQATFMTPLSPLRITHGESSVPQSLNNQSSSSFPPINISNDISNQLVTEAQVQADGIGNVANKVDSLEAAIERLVGSLPSSTEYQLPLDLDSNPIGKSHAQNANLFQPPTDLSRPDYDGSNSTNVEFDTDAFMRTLVSSGNEDQTNSIGGARTSNLNPIGSQEMGVISAPQPLEESATERRNNTLNKSANTTKMKQQPADQDSRSRLTSSTEENPMDTSDLDRILDEWICEDAARMSPVLGINAGKLTSSLSRSPTKSSDLRGLCHNQHHQGNYDLKESSIGTTPQLFSKLNPSSCGSSSQQLIASAADGSNNSTSSRLTLDLNDDDELRRIMRKKPPSTSSAINYSKNGETGMLVFSHHNKNGGDHATSINNLMGSSTSNNNDTKHHTLVNNNDNHHPISIRKRFLDDSNQQSFHHLIPSHHFNDLGNVNDQSKSRSSVTLQQKKSRIY